MRPLESETPALALEIEQRAVPLHQITELKPLIERLSRARVVMLGESTHGTHDFYDWRRVISEWLIVKHGFRFIAVEGDWPPCWQLTEFLKNRGPVNPVETLAHFKRWPTWMWANTSVLRLAEWLRTHNLMAAPDHKVGFYGLDLYSLFESIDAAVAQAEKVDAHLARDLRERYACFAEFGGDERLYAKSLVENPGGCRQAAQEALEGLLRFALFNGGSERAEALFSARQNARIVVSAERYHRILVHGGGDSWNLRDTHMADTLERLLAHHGPESKAIVWAHNTHVGDHRATETGKRGQFSLGGLARQRWGEENVALVGFGTHQGEVIASGAWDGPTLTLRVPPARPDAVENALHIAAVARSTPAFYLTFDDETRKGPLSETRGHRAVGVVYSPAHERYSNYLRSSFSRLYDAFLFIDRTAPLVPLQQPFDRREVPETWPAGR